MDAENSLEGQLPFQEAATPRPESHACARSASRNRRRSLRMRYVLEPLTPRGKRLTRSCVGARRSLCQSSSMLDRGAQAH
eukprot:6173229-Pleurochrysis_carterae.AAC.4